MGELRKAGGLRYRGGEIQGGQALCPRGRERQDTRNRRRLVRRRYSFELDISDGFEPARLELNFIDLSDLGVPDPLLTEVLYDGISMYFEHEDFTAREMLDVRFLERGREADQGS